MKLNERFDWISAVFIIYMPSVFLLRGKWLFAAIWGLVLGGCLFAIPVFIKYRKKIKGFLPFIIFVNILALLLGVLVSFNKGFLITAVFIWLICSSLIGWPIAKQLKKL